MAKLTDKQSLFVEAYLECWNATEAARRAKYKHPRQMGSENLSKPVIKKRITQRLQATVMLADEVLARLAEIARSEYAGYITTTGSVDFARLVKDGKAHLVKSIRDTKYGKSIEFYDGQKALVDIGRHHQLFTDKVDVSGGEPIVLKVIYDDGEPHA